MPDFPCITRIYQYAVPFIQKAAKFVYSCRIPSKMKIVFKSPQTCQWYSLYLIEQHVNIILLHMKSMVTGIDSSVFPLCNSIAFKLRLKTLKILQSSGLCSVLIRFIKLLMLMQMTRLSTILKQSESPTHSCRLPN